MKHRKWIWLAVAIAALAYSAWGLATPITVRASESPSKILLVTGVELLSGVVGIVCLFTFIKLYKAHNKQQKEINSFLNK